MFKPYEGADFPGLTQSILFTGLVLTVILGFPVHPSLTAPASRPWAAAQLLSCSIWLEMLWPETFKKGWMGLSPSILSLDLAGDQFLPSL